MRVASPAKFFRRLREFYRSRGDDVFAPVNVNHLIEPVVSLTQPRWKDQALAGGLVIRVETDLQEVPSIEGNEAELREALTNLIFNAVDALPDGGVITLRSRALRILMAEDEPLILETQAEYLQADGHTVDTACNGREGWEKFRTQKYDLVVLDRAMPEMNGDQLAAAIKQASPQTPVIMVTGFGDMIKVTEGQPSCVDAVVGKPVTLTQLREAVAQLSPRLVPAPSA